MKITFISLFWSCAEGLLASGGRRHLSAANQVSHPYVSVSNTSYRSLMVAWMEGDGEINDEWL
jgi:hypothetical protein